MSIIFCMFATQYKKYIIIMKQKETIERKIASHKASIEKFSSDSSLSGEEKKNVIFTLQELIRQLKWVLK